MRLPSLLGEPGAVHAALNPISQRRKQSQNSEAQLRLGDALDPGPAPFELLPHYIRALLLFPCLESGVNNLLWGDIY